MRFSAFLMLTVLLALQSANAQRGDQPGEDQRDPPSALTTKASPPLSPAESAKLLQVVPELTVDLVAAEPLVGDPVFAAFDPRGRLWVVEMRGYMPDVEGHGEEDPSGRIVVLEDLDKDGDMDQSTVFLDGLVLPRALAFVENAVLFLEPPYLVRCEYDENTLKPGKDRIVASGFGGRISPEHAANGLLPSYDGFIEFANHPLRLRDLSGRIELQAGRGGGQWGLTHDDFGRLFYNSNSDALRADLVPAHLAIRNREQRSPSGVNVRIVRSQAVRPLHPTPGINRAYRKGVLTDDGKLREFTAACSPFIYRGDALPPEYRGNAFVCEPSANLVKRYVLSETNEGITAQDPYSDREFLASTDERFRPVHLFSGPDGALYVLDMARGVIQHRLFVTSYLRRQIKQRALETPIGMGRIWRIRSRSGPARDLRERDPEDARTLHEDLLGVSGFHRDQALRLLLEREDRIDAQFLRAALRSHRDAAIRALCLRALARSPKVHRDDLRLAATDPDARVRMVAALVSGDHARVAETRAAGLNRLEATSVLRQLSCDDDPRVRRHVALVSPEPSIVLDCLRGMTGDAGVRSAALANQAGRELAFILEGRDSGAFLDDAPGIQAIYREFAAASSRRRQPPQIEAWMDLATQSVRPRASILEGLEESLRPKKQLRFKKEPASLLRLAAWPEESVREKALPLSDGLTWPGKPGFEDVLLVPLSPAEESLRRAGERHFQSFCAGCHQLDGRGLTDVAPSLAESPWVEGQVDHAVLIVRQGLVGKIRVDGVDWDLEMSAFDTLDEDVIAAILTYLRRAFGNEGSPVTPDTVRRILLKHGSRTKPWTASELLALPKSDG